MLDIRYTIIDFGMLPGYTLSSAEAVNDTGQIIGTMRQNGASDKSSAYFWEQGRMRRLIGGASVSAINNKGEIVGTKLGPVKANPFVVGFSLHAISFVNGKPHPLFNQEVDYSTAEAINDSG